MIELTVPFVFPGEGAIVNSVYVTVDTPIDPSQLEHLAGGIRGGIRLDDPQERESGGSIP